MNRNEMRAFKNIQVTITRSPLKYLWIFIFIFPIFGILFFAFSALKYTDAYPLSMKEITNSSIAKQELGSPIESPWFVFGSLSGFGESTGSTVLEYNVSGPLGKGEIIATAYKDFDTWKLTSVTLSIPKKKARFVIYPNIPFFQKPDGTYQIQNPDIDPTH